MIKVFLTDVADKSVNRATVMQYSIDNQRYTSTCKSVDISAIPEPDRHNLKETVSQILADEQQRGNHMSIFDLFILYPGSRYKGLRNHTLTVNDDAAKWTEQAPKLASGAGSAEPLTNEEN